MYFNTLLNNTGKFLKGNVYIIFYCPEITKQFYMYNESCNQDVVEGSLNNNDGNRTVS